MKKLIIIITVCLLAVLAFCSCKKEPINDMQTSPALIPNNDKGLTIIDNNGELGSETDDDASTIRDIDMAKEP